MCNVRLVPTSGAVVASIKRISKTVRIPISEVHFSNLSLMDVGRVFYWKGGVYRAIKKAHSDDIRGLFSSGLIDRLVKEGLFVPSSITDLELKDYGLVVQHSPFRVVTYPHEWSFSMLRCAALLVLRMNEVATEYGYQTYDCHGYNVLFEGERPVYVDLGSFTRYRPTRRELLSYDEFLRAYDLPLRLWARLGGAWGRKVVPRANYLLSTEDYLKVRWGVYRLPVVRQVGRAIAKLQRFYCLKDETLQGYESRHPWWKVAIVKAIRRYGAYPASISTLRNRVARIEREEERSLWSNYHDSLLSQNGQVSLSPRLKTVMDCLIELDTRSVLEIAGNQGVLSRELKRLKPDLQVTCTDADESALDKGYVAGSKGATGVQWAVLNPFLTEKGSTEQDPTKRYCADAVVALALSHHLVLTQGYPLSWILETLSQYANRYLLFEFMPLGLFDGRSAPPLPEWYTRDWFEEHLEARFDVLKCVQTEENRILYVGEKRGWANLDA